MRPTPARASRGRPETRPLAGSAWHSSRATASTGYPSALTVKTWGFYDVLFDGQPFKFERGYGTYVMENILFKISFPAEFHAQRGRGGAAAASRGGSTGSTG